MFEIAPQFGALLIFAEHRYYGTSLPFGNSSFTLENVGLLTTEQAMADFAVLIYHLKESLNATKCPVIAFGGSYGGMLSAYMRFKYPNLIDGAIAASAPIYLSSGQASREYFFEDVTHDFELVSPKCTAAVKDAFVKLVELSEQGQSGLQKLTEIFKLCKTLKKDRVNHLMGWVRNAFATLAMMDYPYATSFLSDLPAYPVKVACGYILGSTDSLHGLAQAAGLLYNGTSGKLPCFDIETDFIECADPTGCGVGNSGKAWDNQACTEFIMPGGSNNVTDMFPVLPFTLEMRDEYCQKQWNITPRNNWLNVNLWGRDISSASNIVFSNGNLDPWRRGGVTESVSESLVAILIEGGAHHLDLRSSNPADPPSVVQARAKEVQYIQQWIKQAQRNNSKQK
ncbi:dipeptidyl peptidase 2-like [Ptychodera flava]|uniref:dipeptidyl peptidase 2-like n=1 Tax=Ptychodera flava TaxID=63121 RepID=UPI00396A3083